MAKSYGQIAFEAHIASQRGFCQQWELLSEQSREAWRATARAVLCELMKDVLPRSVEIEPSEPIEPIKVASRLGLTRVSAAVARCFCDPDEIDLVEGCPVHDPPQGPWRNTPTEAIATFPRTVNP